MKYCGRNKYVNEQTYIKTVCKANAPQKQNCCVCKGKNYAECNCGNENGRVTLSIDECTTKLSICVNNKKGQN